MFAIRQETPFDVVAREMLLDRCFGEGRLLKTCERLRAGRRPADGLAFAVERDGRLVGTVRLWNVSAGTAHLGRSRDAPRPWPNSATAGLRQRPALLLGPVAVAPELQGCGIGGRLVRESLDRARALGHGAVILVGDEPYYRRFGFSREPVLGLSLPGPFESERFLGLELAPGALAGARGLVTAAGAREPTEVVATALDGVRDRAA